MSDHNRKRALADMVALDAWRGGSPGKAKVDLHVDVVFGVARVGGGVDERARFRLSLRRAEVVVIIPPTEPARIDPETVARGGAAKVSVKDVETYKQSKRIGAMAKAEIGVGVSSPKARAKAGLSVAASTGRDKVTTLSRQSDSMLVVQSQTVDGDYRWIITPSIDGDILDGHPWNAKKAPRLKVTDLRQDRGRGIEPGVRVELRCLREDLEINNIVLSDASLWASLTKSPTHRNRVAAAEAVIRDRMMKAGLVHGALDDPYAQMCLAEVTVGGEA
jgi:hypothetical protein